jgi:hypothetical protein
VELVIDCDGDLLCCEGCFDGYVMMNCELGKREARAVCVLEGLTWFGMELIEWVIWLKP